MRFSTLTGLFLAVPFMAFAQSFPEFNYLQSDMLLQNCRFDETVQVTQPEHWLVYQTENGIWDGPIDSTRCFDFVPDNNGQMMLDLEQVDPTGPLFFRYQFIDEEIALPPNWVFRSYNNYWTDAAVIQADTCAGDICSGLIINYDIPNEAGDSTETRSIKNIFGGYKAVEGCWTSENFAEMPVKEIIVQFTFEEDDMSGLIFKPWDFTNEQLYEDEFAEILALVFYEWNQINDSTYSSYIYDAAFPEAEWWWNSMYFVKQETGLYPSFDNYTFIEAMLEEPATEQKELRLYLDFEDQLLFQPFTGVRGSLVEGSDSLRHELVVEYELPNTCQFIIVDLVIPGNTTYRFGGGQLEFAQRTSCFMFMDGGRLKVREGEQLQYGSAGVGVLGLAREGRIILEPNRELLIENRMQLVAFSGGPSEQAYVELPPGSRLVFGENASLSRTLGEHMYLNVYMKGGELDDSALSPQERSLIRRIYPEAPVLQANKILVTPNPSQYHARLILPTHFEEDLPIQLVDALGRTVYTGAVSSVADRQYELPHLALAEGWYMIIVETPQGILSGRWLIQ